MQLAEEGASSHLTYVPHVKTDAPTSRSAHGAAINTNFLIILHFLLYMHEYIDFSLSVLTLCTLKK